MVVLVTGCRSGFGKLAAEELGRRGHTVYAGLRDVTTGDALRDATAGLDVRPLALDVTRADEREAAVERILAEHGRIDALVNNAGRALGGFLEQVDEDELRALYDVNVFAVFALTQLVLPPMRAQGAGRIVMVSSTAGQLALPGLGAYASSKFALEGLSEAWRQELLPFGIGVHLLEPGAYATDIWGRNRALARRATAGDGPYAERQRHMEALYERMMPRAHDPHDVALEIARMVEGERPVLRHMMGPDTWKRRLLKRFAPQRVVEAMVRRMTTP
jgi:NAD(P)-dependent dehydrogenase (short-subunit alcohol dehydrogenase family)